MTSYTSSGFSSVTTGTRLTDIRGENLSLMRRPFCCISAAQLPRASSVTSFPARNRSLARLQPSTPAPNTRILITKPPVLEYLYLFRLYPVSSRYSGCALRYGSLSPQMV